MEAIGFAIAIALLVILVEGVYDLGFADGVKQTAVAMIRGRAEAEDRPATRLDT